MITVNLRQLKEIIKMSINQKLSLLVLGSPGIGKTECITVSAKETGINILIHDAPGLDPTDVRGLQAIDCNRSFYSKSALLPIPEIHGEKGILLFDELTSAMPSVGVALHSVFHPHERRLGTDRLPDGWIAMATGNYATDGAGANGLLTALSDRMNVVNVVSDFHVWKEDYAIPKGLNPVVIGLLNFRPELLNTFDKRAKGEKGKLFASERSHSLVSAVLNYADTSNMSDIALMAAIAGYVGDGVAAEYIAFRKVYRELPDPISILNGADIIPTEPSILFALSSALVHHIKTADMGIQKAIDRFLEYGMKLDAEYAKMMLKDAHILYKKEMTQSKQWPIVARRYF